jgi:hypothetical protein
MTTPGDPQPSEAEEPTLIEQLRQAADELGSGQGNVNGLLREAARDLEEWDQAFEAYWAANRRGTELYNAAHPGSERTLPDQAKMVAWLVDELARLHTIIAKQQEALNEASKKLFEAGKFTGQQHLKIEELQALIEPLQREIKRQIIEEALRKKASGQS